MLSRSYRFSSAGALLCTKSCTSLFRSSGPLYNDNKTSAALLVAVRSDWTFGRAASTSSRSSRRGRSKGEEGDRTKDVGAGSRLGGGTDGPAKEEEAPKLTYVAQSSIYKYFMKWSYLWFSTSTLAAIACGGFGKALGLTYLYIPGLLALYPAIKCVANAKRTVLRVDVLTDSKTLRETPRFRAPKPAEDGKTSQPPSGVAGAQGMQADTQTGSLVTSDSSKRALVEAKVRKELAVRPETNIYDPLHTLIEDEAIVFNYLKLTLLQNRTIRVDLEDVEWLAYEVAVDERGRDTHLWRLLKVRHEDVPYNIFLTTRFDPVLQSIVHAVPTVRLVEVCPEYLSFDYVPLFGWKVVTTLEAGLPPSSPEEPAKPAPASSPSAGSGTGSGPQSNQK